MDWQGRVALVTGAGGFIGGHLVAALVQRGAHVRALCRYTSRGDRGTLDWFDADVLQSTEVLFGDLRDPDSLQQATSGVDTVFHLGALISVPHSFTAPAQYVATNVEGTLNVAEAVLRAGARRMVHLSSSEVYGEVTSWPITESHPLNALSPYAASKIGADMLVHSLHRARTLPVTIARPFNTYGPHQSARAVIPAIGIQALEGRQIRLGRLDPRRDLTFVSDTVEGLLALAAGDATLGEVVQLGTGRDVSIGELVELVGEILEVELEVETDPVRFRPGTSEVERLVCDPGKAERLTGWRAETDIRAGLTETLGWLAEHRAHYRSERYAV